MTYHITNDLKICSAPFPLGIETNDADKDGYLVSNPEVNRRLMAGIGADGEGVLVMMISNGNPVLIDDDLRRDRDRLAEVCHDMADAPEHDLNQGFDRLRGIADAVRREYPAWPESVDYWNGWCAWLPAPLGDSE